MYNNYGKTRPNRDHRNRGEGPYNGKGPMNRGHLRGGPGGGGGDFRSPMMGPSPSMHNRYNEPQPRMSRTRKFSTLFDNEKNFGAFNDLMNQHASDFTTVIKIFQKRPCDKTNANSPN